MTETKVFKKFNTISIGCCLLVLTLWAPQVTGRDCEYSYENGEWTDDCDLSVGAIIGIIVAAIIIFIVIPTLLCFCCAWACFRGRRTKGEVHTYIVPAPQPGSYPQQPQPSTVTGAESNYPPGPPPYNYGSNLEGTSGYGYNNMPAAPPPYNIQPQPFNQYQNPPYPTNQHQNNPPPAGWQPQST